MLFTGYVRERLRGWENSQSMTPCSAENGLFHGSSRHLLPGREGLHHLGAGGPIETSAADADQEAIETPFF